MVPAAAPRPVEERRARTLPDYQSPGTIYLLSLAEMTGVDLQDEIEAKMAQTRHASTAPCRMAYS